MVNFICNQCGGNDFIEENGQRICKYCGTKYILTSADKRVIESTIDLNDDVAMLLQKCKSDPERAKKYAQRILEIDANNIEAKKYLSNNNGSSSGCYVATAVYGSYDCPQVWTLRRFRDDTLAETWYGRAFIHTYYAISPTLVKWFGKTEWFKNLWKPTLDRMVERLNNEGVENTPYTDRNW